MLKSFLLFLAVCPALFAQKTAPTIDENISKANEIIKNYYKAIKYEKQESFPENLSIKYKVIWKVNEAEVSSLKSFYGSGKSLKSEDKNSPEGVRYSRKSTLNETSFYREFTTTGTGSGVKKLDLSKAENKNDSEIRLLKREALTIFFPVMLKAPWYRDIDLKYIGIAEAGKGKAYVLEWNGGSNVNIKVLFDTTSNLLIMWKFTTTSSDGTTNIYDYYLSDYKEFSGCKIASVINAYKNQEFDERFEISEFQKNVKFDAKFFEIQDK